jgi:hypothetical protein
VPGTATAGAPEVRVKVAVVREAGSIALLKVTLRFSLTGTLLPPLAGVLERIVGALADVVAEDEPPPPELPQAVKESSRSKEAPDDK